MYYFKKDIDICRDKKELCNIVREHLPWVKSSDEELCEIINELYTKNAMAQNYSFFLSELLIKVIHTEMDLWSYSLNIEFVTD